MAETRKVIVTELRPLRTGTGQYGEWTLYEVKATSPDGAPIVPQLRTFQELPVGEAIDVLVERRENEHGVTYTLKRPRARHGPAGAELQRQLECHEEMISKLHGRVTQVEESIEALTRPQLA